MEQHLRVDTRRRVVMGYSVAAIPMAGTPGEIDLDTLRDLPLYVIHSEADRRVPIEDAAKAVARLHAMGAPVEFARLPSGDHFEYRLVGLDHGIGHFMLVEVDSEAQAAVPPIPKSPQTSSAASDRKIAPQPSSHQAV